MDERETDLLVVDGGLGGVAAALAGLRLGRRVVLSEPTDWLGGQLTAQAVPPDEHRWIEQFGCSPSYRALRERIRDAYRRDAALRPEARADPHLNPGCCWVSRLCHEPRVAVAAIEAMLAPHRANGRLVVLLRHRPVSADTDGDRVRAVTLRDETTGEEVVVAAPFVLDATELGDLLPLAGVEHVVGGESQAETGEPHALPGPADPRDQQAVSWVFALDHRPGEDHTIERPADYAFWRGYQAAFQPAPILSWSDQNPDASERRDRAVFADPAAGDEAEDFWRYRRVRCGALSRSALGRNRGDLSLVNWPQNDYWLGPIVGVPEAEAAVHRQGARQLGLALLYWMQTEAPRPDGGQGYPGLRLRPDVVDTDDGFAKHVYVRESRRVRAEFTVREQHVGVAARSNQRGAEPFTDSVGVGGYRLDLHPSTALRPSVDLATYPFQIPLGALIPVRMENLLPACKNIGTTHLTNGCYRLHPVEWAIGEAAGALAAHCLGQRLTPRQVRNTPRLLADFQRLLGDAFGAELAWPEAVRGIPV